jgi:hypothetical protein
MLYLIHRLPIFGSPDQVNHVINVCDLSATWSRTCRRQVCDGSATGLVGNPGLQQAWSGLVRVALVEFRPYKTVNGSDLVCASICLRHKLHHYSLKLGVNP